MNEQTDPAMRFSEPPPYRPGLAVAGIHEIWGEIERLDLVRNVAELEAFGFTVIPPDRAAPSGLADRLCAAVLDVAAERWGVRLDPAEDFPSTGPTNVPDPQDWANMLNRPTLHADFPQIPRVYEEALMNPVLLALVTYMLGYQCLLSSGFGAWIKGRNPGETFPLHMDGARVSPALANADCCNAMYLLSDHSLADGATCFVAGSHKLQRAPAHGEGLDERIALAAPAGSLVVWHGNTWHGAFPRTKPGLRISMPLFFCRPQLRTFSNYEHRPIPQEMLDRNPPRFSTLLGRELDWREYCKLERGAKTDFHSAAGSSQENIGAMALRAMSLFGA